MATSAEIREGFLCPMCMKDLGTVTQLQSHFEESHSTEDKAVFNHLRGLFDRAKKKILGDRDDSDDIEQSSKSSSSVAPQSTSLYDVDYWAPQEIGAIHSLTDNFRALRDARVDKYVVETNKLLIRLDKLISPDAPAEGSKRKAFEQSLVMWVPDSEVKSCPFCGRSFGMTRRRHHCRLCGGIMCDRCSHFLTHAYAKSAAEKLTNPAFSFDSSREAGFLKRSSSNSSLNSLFSTEGDPHLRICQECRKLLERRDQMVEQRNIKPSIVLLYEKLKLYISECETLLEEFLPIVESLSVGDSTYNLQDAQKMRGKLVKLYEYIDQLSKRILSLDMDKQDLPSAKQANLQKAIRVYASNFMQENMMGLQNLPSEEQYKKLQKRRTAEIQKRIASERQATIAAQEQERRLLQEQMREEEKRERAGSHKKSDSASGKSWLPSDGHKRSDSTGKGWKPAENVMTTSTSDPMMQQMEIISGYIKQARDARKWDEVKMLEQNLKDLQMEYSSQQKQTWS